MATTTDVSATLNGFIRRDVRPDGPLPIRLNGAGDDGPPPWDPAPAQTIHDARPRLAEAASEAAFFDTHGYVLLDHVSGVRDWDVDAAVPVEANDIARIYLPEVDALIRQRLLPGRRLELLQSPNLVRRGPGASTPFYAKGVHGDYGLTADDYAVSLEAYTSPETTRAWRALYDRPEVAGFMVINLWRTVYMDGPLRHLPLAVCDPASVEADDVVSSALVGFTPTGKPTRQLSLRYNPAHRWSWFPGMTRDEVLAFKVFETFKDDRRPGLQTCFHTAFEDPGAPPDAPERQSCEHRVSVFIFEGQA